MLMKRRCLKKNNKPDQKAKKQTKSKNQVENIETNENFKRRKIARNEQKYYFINVLDYNTTAKKGNKMKI